MPRTILLLALAACAPRPSPPASIAEGGPPTVVAFGSCAGQDGPQDHWVAIQSVDPQAFVFLGDNVYGDTGEVDGRFTLYPADMDRLRRAYDDLAAVHDFKVFRSRVPILPTWDDHDYGENDAGAELPIRAESEALFLDFWRVPEDDPRRSRPGVYTAERIDHGGHSIQIVLLDTRSFRSPLRPSAAPGTPGREVYEPDPDPTKTMLGAEQWAWLERTLAEPADLRVVVSSVQVIAQGHGFEGWATLPHERERLLATLRGVGPVVVVSGDRHQAGLYRHDTDGTPLFEMTTSSLNKSFGGRPEPGPHRLGELYGPENFGTIEVDWASGEAWLRVRDVLEAQVVREVRVPGVGGPARR